MTHPSIVRIAGFVIIPVVSVALVACGGDGSAAANGASGNATVRFDGEELPIRDVSCVVVEGNQRVFAGLDLEPEYSSELGIRDSWGNIRIELTLPTELDSPRGFDVWEANRVEGVDLSDRGASGRLEIEGTDAHDVGAREPGLLEFDISCPE